MDINTTQYKNCDLVKVSGRVDSLTAPQLAEVLKSITDSSRFAIVLDLENVTYTSSAGLRVMIDTQKTCKPHRGEVVLACVPQRVYETLDLAGLVVLFRFFDNITTAIGNI